MPVIYSSVQNDKIKEIKKLNQKKYRDEKNKFLVEGEHLVIESYKAGYLEELIILENTDFSLDIKTSVVTLPVLKYITELDTPPKILGISKKIKEKEIGKKILMLDRIQDPGNLGTIIRSAAAFNIDTIIISKDCVDLYNSKVVRATQGLIFNTNIIICDLEEKLKELKKENYKVLTTKVDGGKLIKDIDKNNKIVIIIGNEGNGVSENLCKLSDEFIYIKMNEKCESLNAAVATSIILYELNRW